MLIAGSVVRCSSLSASIPSLLTTDRISFSTFSAMIGIRFSRANFQIGRYSSIGKRQRLSYSVRFSISASPMRPKT